MINKSKLFKISGFALLVAVVFTLTFPGGVVRAQNNDDQVVVGFANMADSISFCQLVKRGILEEAKERGWKVIALDNELSGQKAVQNTRQLIQQNVDIVIMYNIEASTQPVISNMLKDADMPAIAIDIFLPDFPFFGVNNERVGKLAGRYLGYYAKFNWNRKPDMLVLLDNPKGGEYAKVRTDGIRDGFYEAWPNFPEKRIKRVDAEADVMPAQEAMSNVLSGNPDAEYIMASGINDQVVRGGLSAIKSQNRAENAILVSMGADESFLKDLQSTKAQGSLKAGVTFAPEKYGEYLMPVVEKILEGEEVPERNYVFSNVVDKYNIDSLYPEFAWEE